MRFKQTGSYHMSPAASGQEEKMQRWFTSGDNRAHSHGVYRLCPIGGFRNVQTISESERILPSNKRPDKQSRDVKCTTFTQIKVFLMDV
ncbi:hypothetical protein VZT92_014695 [Zoarces viviparus]|uniref:Uncharacterized protein n=1 Tax=Zoarces viviparus TaxID=48416 RepID=A0AAW1F214_ZOAVI